MKHKCRECLTETDSTSNLVGEHATPATGDISLCLYCGALSVFGTQNAFGFLRAAREDDLDGLTTEQLAAIYNAQRMIRARGARDN